MVKAARQAHLPTPALWRNFKRWGIERTPVNKDDKTTSSIAGLYFAIAWTLCAVVLNPAIWILAIGAWVYVLIKLLSPNDKK